ncbi:MAG: aldo/keto reductase [Gemmatimonadota bacterium]|nr:aldo/keto reductase [Gemmatimonadota bacterium]MDH3367369.1 aldo/keto reductase [Gemmatimonadota bacterium]MDH3569775.1 aldo/keto reductase [Gemmatimonadota bacterium]MDH5549761.1 aldo/keto reductase [Gemmatimonadota bacterium]
MAPQDVSRRDFVKMGAAGTASVWLCRDAPLGPELPMPERPLGRTGHPVRLFSLGGQATLEQAGKLDESVSIINRAIDLGVNYIDTAAAYGRGLSQSYIGEVMATRRKEVFLATKTHDRTRDGSLRLLEDSLKRLQTDHVDLWQLHNVRNTEQLDRIFAQQGAMEAMQQAREEGMVRFLGITGHYDPAVLLDGINRFGFDTILMALNPADPYHLPFAAELLPAANRKQMGVIAMKIPARGRVFQDGGLRSMKDAMCWVLTHPVSTVIVGCDTVAQLEENVRIAQEFQAMDKEELARVSGMVEPYAAQAAFFKQGAAGSGEDYDHDWE